MKRICFDLDGTICNNTWGDYKNAKPNKNAINKINDLYEKKNHIIIFTARFTGKNNENLGKFNKKQYEFTKNQIDNWGLKYHELILGKPTYDILVDDKHFNYKDDWIVSYKF